MATADTDEDLVNLIDKIDENTEGDQVSVRDIVEALDRRAFGSLFVLTALVAILPTGAIPGMSILTGTIMLLLSVQLLIGRTEVWLPNVLMKRSIKRETLIDSLEKARGPAERVDSVLGKRLTLFLNPPFLQIIALFGIVISLSMYPLALVPFGAFPAGLSLLVIGAGLMVRDGLLIALGCTVGLVGLAIAFMAVPI